MFKFFSKLSEKPVQNLFNPVNSGKFFSASFAPANKQPVRVAVTGAAGQIGYAALFRIASGEMLGKDQPIILHCLELPHAIELAKGIKMELDDCAFPLLKDVVVTSDQNEGFAGVDYALLIGAKPRGPGMERADLLKENASIFKLQGKAINDNANSNIKVVVVGNPANTNALIASSNAPKIDPKQFSALTVLDHNRGLAQLAQKTGCDVTDIEKFAIWGNHSPSMYPDVTHTTIKGKAAREVINDEAWITDNFMPRVQKRGAEVIKARGGTSSAASAASASIEHMRNWVLGTNGKWASMAVWADGNYGVNDVYFSYPVICENGDYKIVQNLDISSPLSAKCFKATTEELHGEAEATKDFR